MPPAFTKTKEGRRGGWKENPDIKGKGQISRWQIQGVGDEENNWEGGSPHGRVLTDMFVLINIRCDIA